MKATLFKNIADLRCIVVQARQYSFVAFVRPTVIYLAEIILCYVIDHFPIKL